MGRHSHTPTSNSGSATGRRDRGQGEEGGEAEERVNGDNGQLKHAPPQAEEASDVDELVDSESERAEMDQLAKTRAAAAKTASSRPRGRGQGAAAKGQGRGQVGQTAQQQQSSQRARAEDPASPKAVLDSAPSPTKSSPPKGAETVSAPTSSSSSSKAHTSSEAAKGPYSPRELLGRTATGGAVPYYYPQSNVATVQSSQSPREGHARKSARPTPGYKTELGESTDELMPQEVDKFLDLIEKHNLHTSNEDDMARSVTELYQEWLEWCAKRNIQSTKSKQALVAEFVRIHQGAYGPTRQQRAMEIVQGSGGSNGLEGMAGRESERQSRNRSVPPSSKAGSSSRVPSTTFKEEETGQGGGPKRVEAMGRGYIHVPSPLVVPRALTPGPSGGYNDTHSGLSAPQMDVLHRRVRDSVWKEASAMLSHLVGEQMAELAADNSGLRGRVEQLEIHSDNLAQWIQHLNRVQEDLTLRTTRPPPSIRDEVMVDDPGAKYSHLPGHAARPVMGGRERNYAASSYPPGGPASTHSSPRRSFATRHSPSPVMVHHSIPHPSSTRRQGPAAPPPHPQYQTQAAPTYRDYPLEPREILYSSHSKAGPPEHHDRAYYAAYPPDDRDPPLPPPPLPHSPRQAKRARNGY